ncbi:MAG: MerR family transcriptional regulator [Myxococcales bacterium]|nr:MAG: MerR family transcriptional regulator [Myxococcales bacterium]
MPRHEVHERPIYTIQQLSALVGMPVGTIRWWIKRGWVSPAMGRDGGAPDAPRYHDGHLREIRTRETWLRDQAEQRGARRDARHKRAGVVIERTEDAVIVRWSNGALSRLEHYVEIDL